MNVDADFPVFAGIFVDFGERKVLQNLHLLKVLRNLHLDSV